jgi:hypothetical protein
LWPVPSINTRHQEEREERTKNVGMQKARFHILAPPPPSLNKLLQCIREPLFEISAVITNVRCQQSVGLTETVVGHAQTVTCGTAEPESGAE